MIRYIVRDGVVNPRDLTTPIWLAREVPAQVVRVYTIISRAHTVTEHLDSWIVQADVFIIHMCSSCSSNNCCSSSSNVCLIVMEGNVWVSG